MMVFRSSLRGISVGFLSSQSVTRRRCARTDLSAAGKSPGHYQNRPRATRAKRSKRITAEAQRKERKKKRKRKKKKKH
jgi:hypothetical protein